MWVSFIYSYALNINNNVLHLQTHDQRQTLTESVSVRELHWLMQAKSTQAPFSGLPHDNMMIVQKRFLWYFHICLVPRELLISLQKTSCNIMSKIKSLLSLLQLNWRLLTADESWFKVSYTGPWFNFSVLLKPSIHNTFGIIMIYV